MKQYKEVPYEDAMRGRTIELSNVVDLKPSSRREVEQACKPVYRGIAIAVCMVIGAVVWGGVLILFLRR